MREIVVVDYGMGNIHSILKALRLYSSHVVYSADPRVVAKADLLVLPGDGAFGAAMAGLDGELRQEFLAAVARGVPTLGVCIGFQILFQDSNEAFAGDAERTVGLGLIPGVIRRFSFSDASVRVPHMGWNQLEYAGATQPGPHMYFIHSYRATQVPDEFVVARCNYAGDVFPAIVKKDNLLAMQFHPEKSDAAGLDMIGAWVRGK